MAIVLATKRKPKMPGQFVRTGECARYRLRGPDGEPTKHWITVTVLGPDKFNGFVVQRTDTSKARTIFGSASNFEYYTELFWAGHTTLTDEELAYLAQPTCYGQNGQPSRHRFHDIRADAPRIREALPKVDDLRLAEALEHDVEMYERMLGALDRGRTIGQMELFEFDITESI